jgi:hypothetical protein
MISIHQTNVQNHFCELNSFYILFVSFSSSGGVEQQYRYHCKGCDLLLAYRSTEFKEIGKCCKSQIKQNNK